MISLQGILARSMVGIAMAILPSLSSAATITGAAVPLEPVSPLQVTGATTKLDPNGTVVLPNGVRTTIAAYFAQKLAVAKNQRLLRAQYQPKQNAPLAALPLAPPAISNPGPVGGIAILSSGQKVPLDLIYQYDNALKAAALAKGCIYRPDKPEVDLDSPECSSPSPANVPTPLPSPPSGEACTYVPPISEADQVADIQNQVKYFETFRNGSVPVSITEAALPYCSDLRKIEQSGSSGDTIGVGTLTIPIASKNGRVQLAFATTISPSVNGSLTIDSGLTGSLYGRSISLANINAHLTVTNPASVTAPTTATGAVTATLFGSSIYKTTFTGNVSFNDNGGGPKSIQFCDIPVANELILGVPLSAKIVCTGSDSLSYSFDANPGVAYINVNPQLDASIVGKGTLSAYLAATVTLTGTLHLVSVDGNIGATVGVFTDPFNKKYDVAVYHGYGLYEASVLGGELDYKVSALFGSVQIAKGKLWTLSPKRVTGTLFGDTAWHAVKL